MDKSSFMGSMVAIATAIVGVAIVSVIVSNKANTANVIQAAASGFNNSIGTAISPVTQSKTTISLAYPNYTPPASNNMTIGE